MALVSSIMVVIILMIVPLSIGDMVARKSNIQKNVTLSGILFRYVMGHVFMWATFQFIGVPLILCKKSFFVAVVVWSAATGILFFTSIKYSSFLYKKKSFSRIGMRHKSLSLSDVSTFFLALVTVGVIGVQCYYYIFQMHVDADDSRYVVNALEAYYNNSMLLVNPATGEYVGTWIGELVKDVTSPWTIYLAVLSKLVVIHPTIFIHTILPPFLVLMMYSAYWLLGNQFFGKDYKSNCIFVFIVAFINMYFNDSTHTQSFVALVRIWQGKAVVAGVMIPVMLYLLMLLYQNGNNKCIYLLLFAASMGMSLLSGIGIICSGVLVVMVGGYFLLIRRQWRMLPYLTVCGLPSLIYGGIYACIR